MQKSEFWLHRGASRLRFNVLLIAGILVQTRERSRQDNPVLR
jgi:hypothetical protein